MKAEMQKIRRTKIKFLHGVFTLLIEITLQFFPKLHNNRYKIDQSL